jgi:hypothetical protein
MSLDLKSTIMKGDVLDAVEHDVMMHKCWVRFIFVGIIIVGTFGLFFHSCCPEHQFMF